MYLKGAGIQSAICFSEYSCIQCIEVCGCVSVVGGGVRVGASGPNYSGVGEETHAAALQILGETQHGPHPAESSLLFY